jgi:hypothetical protein
MKKHTYYEKLVIYAVLLILGLLIIFFTNNVIGYLFSGLSFGAIIGTVSQAEKYEVKHEKRTRRHG